MSSGGVNGSSSGRGNNNGVSSIPATSRKMVQSLKEIVNCPDHEIYAMLKECNMDPHDAVQRLLSQDTFHEVKSKREKKKEIKEIPESRSRISSTSNRGGRGIADRNVGRGVAAHTNTESGALHGKPAYRKENGTNAYPGSSTSASALPGINRRPTYLSDSVDVEKKAPSMGSGDLISSSSQPSLGYQPAWVGVPGQVSMAEIVKRGRPQPNASSGPISSTDTSYSRHNAVAPNTSYHSVKDPLVPAPLPSESNHDFHSLNDPSFKVSETIHEAGGAASHHASHNEWPLDEQSAPSGLSVLESSANNEVYDEPSLVSNDRADLHPSSQSDEFRISKEDLNVESLNTEYTASAPSSSRQMQDDSSGDASHFDNDSFNNVNSYQPHVHAFDHREVDTVTVAVSSATADFQQISLQTEPPAEDKPAVKIPNHLQIPIADCMHLSFGSFRSGTSATYPGPFASKSQESTLEEVSAQADVSSIGQSETKNLEYFGDEQFRSTSDGNVNPRTITGTMTSDSPSLQLEVMKQDVTETTHGHNYSYAASVPGYGFENSAHPNTAFSYAHANPQMPNLGPFSSMMQAYTNSLLASNVQAARESDVSYAPFLAAQSMPTKYSNTVSSISGPTISMPETLKPSIFPTTHPTQQNLPSASIATGATLPQHLLHSYNLGQFYPLLAPPSYQYMPPPFQQVYGGNSAYHQTQAAVPSGGMKYTHPQFKNGDPVGNFPSTAAIAASHGGFGGSVNVPGNFQLNQSTNPASSTTGYEDGISSHYRDNNHFLPQQKDSSAIRLQQGPGSRAVSAVPASTYYGYQGQSLQHSGFRQGQQQPSQHYGNIGYPNFYSSQTGGGVSQEHQQPQTQNDGTFGGSQGGQQSSKQSHQIWHHPY